MQNNIPIFLSSDNNYAPFVATTIASICDNTKSFCEFYILDGGITQENQDKICELKKQFDNFSIEFLKINVEETFKKINYQIAQKYITLSTYNRFLIPTLYPDLKKVIYIDIDTIILEDIKFLYFQDLNEYCLGAVHDIKSDDLPFQQYKKSIGLTQNHKYFQAGVLLIDIGNWKKNNVSQKLMDVAVKNSSKYRLQDQDALNVLFENNYKILDNRYNYCVANGVNNPEGEVVIRHFNSQIKPWHINPNTKTDMMPHLKEFWDYAKKTAFYDELYQKTLDNTQQADILRALRVVIITNKIRPKKEK